MLKYFKREQRRRTYSDPTIEKRNSEKALKAKKKLSLESKWYVAKL